MSKRNAAAGPDFVGIFYAAVKQQTRAGLLAWLNAERALHGRDPVDWPRVGATQHDVVWTDGQARLLRYGGAGERRTPLLIVPSLINRHYVLDLLPGRSVVERLRSGGIDVWMLDWGTPIDDDAERGLDDYALEVLPRAAAEIGAPAHVLGYCMGGTMALGAMARGKLVARSLVALATPVDCDDGGTLAAWATAEGFDANELTEAFGNVPEYVLQPAFKMLDPMGLAMKFVHAREKCEDDAFCEFFLAMETWLEDNVPFPGQAFHEWMTLYRENLLARGKWRLGGGRVDLARVRCPILNIVAEKDYICPPRSSIPLQKLSGSRDYELLRMPGGHIGLSTGGAAQKKLWPQVAKWLLARSQDEAKKPTRRRRRA
jgi:poly[(R)-3-hydroxyalkanoate] polymerase subunit PhaC